MGKIQSQHKLDQRIKSWFETTRCIVGYNRFENPQHTHQWGGTAIVLTNKLTPRSTNDTTLDKLGRWTSVVLKGKGHIKTRIVSIYAPHKKGGPLSAVSQHRTYYLSQQQTDHSHKIFWNELTKQLIKWKDNGEQLILGGNWNTDFNSLRIKQLQNQLNLHCILSVANL